MMNRKLWTLILIIAASLSMFSCEDEMSEYEKTKINFLENAKHIEEAMQEVDPEFKSLGYTEVTKISYEIEGGGDIQYYYCKTSYFDEIPELTSVNLQSIRGVIDPDTAENSRNTKVLDYDAIIYTLEGREYLCWSLSPEDSCVLEYTPGTISEDDLWMMAESVQNSNVTGE
ncbi:MAG: hypothetical protein IKI93_18990 [Clostridia bacterium]|nr:hypothetical protein [Oscillospiraceae bacterium]MBR4000420.1 hypothetical protein [Clostridia bacterium]